VSATGQARARLLAGRVREAAVLLEHTRTRLARQYMAGPLMNATLATAELHLCLATGDRHALAQAQAGAQEALGQAVREGRRREEGLARRLLGQCALAMGSPGEAAVHLRASLTLLAEIGAALEAARTRLALAEALVAVGGTGSIPAPARTLATEAQAQFAASGAVLDEAAVTQLLALWELLATPG
jgi:hypothetical protein